MLTLLRSNDPIAIAYLAYCGLTILAALVAGVMYAIPHWRPMLYTAPGTALFVLGMLGLCKLAMFTLFLPLDLAHWSPTAANVVAIVLAVAIVTGVAAGLTLWLRTRLRGQQPIRRIAEDIALWGGSFGALVALDAIEKRYQVPVVWIAVAIVVAIVALVVVAGQARTRRAHRS